MDKLSEAKAMYKTLCKTLDNMKWHYDKEEEQLIIRTSAVGDDLAMRLFMHVDAERQVMYLKSPMPFDVPEKLRDTMGKALLIANYSMLNGSFEYDFSDGYIAFKLLIPFMECHISEAACKYMIQLSCNMTDKFNDKFKAIADGKMMLKEFEAFVKGNS